MSGHDDGLLTGLVRDGIDGGQQQAAGVTVQSEARCRALVRPFREIHTEPVLEAAAQRGQSSPRSAHLRATRRGGARPVFLSQPRIPPLPNTARSQDEGAFGSFPLRSISAALASYSSASARADIGDAPS